MQKILTVVVLLLGLRRVRGQRGRDEDIDNMFPTIFRDDALPSRPTKSDRPLLDLHEEEFLPAAPREVAFPDQRRPLTTTLRPVQNPIRFPGRSANLGRDAPPVPQGRDAPPVPQGRDAPPVPQGRDAPPVPLFITNSAPGFAAGGLDEDYEYDYDDPPLPVGPTRQPAVPIQRFGRQAVKTSGTSLGGSSLSTNNLEQAVLEDFRPSQLPLSRFTTRHPLLSGPSSRRPRTGPLRVTSDLGTLEQSQMFAQMDPNQEQFIRPPKTNAGSLPLASEM